jgi:hypothetical protein
MPSRTLTDKVDELMRTAAVTLHRLDALEDDLARLEQKLSQMTDAFAALTTRMALAEQHLAEMKKANEERDRRLWMIGGSLFVAIIGAVLAFLLRK